jgi:RNA polymerase sigma-70 factor (ECF subfamily)
LQDPDLEPPRGRLGLKHRVTGLAKSCFRATSSIPATEKQKNCTRRADIDRSRCLYPQGVVMNLDEPDLRGLERFRSYLVLLARMRLDRRLQSRLDASDMVQQSLLEAHRGRERFRGRTVAEQAAWLRQILARNLANVVRDLGREKRDIARERSLEADLDSSASNLGGWLAADQTSPSQQAERHERAVWLAQSSSASRVEAGRGAGTLADGTGIQTGAINARTRNERTNKVRSMEATPAERGLESAFPSVMGWRPIALSPSLARSAGRRRLPTTPRDPGGACPGEPAPRAGRPGRIRI